MSQAKPTFSIGNREIGAQYPPFIIAEISGNHGGTLESALAIISRFIAAGASAIKLQTYTADTMTLDIDTDEFYINDEDNLWQGETLHALYDRASTPWEWHEPIFRFCEQQGVPCFSSPFDDSAVDFLESIGAPAYKIASFECVDIPLIERVAKTGKPTIISTGMATANEIADAVIAFRATGGQDLALLKCTSSYPAQARDANLSTMVDLGRKYNCLVGLSDHTLGLAVPISAVALGAVIVEKHVTLSRDNGEVDSAFSLEPNEFESLVVECNLAAQAIGNICYGPTNGDAASLKFRRSLYIAQDLKAGDVLSEVNIRRIRPGLGLAPKYLRSVLGKKVKCDVKRGTPLSRDLF